MADNTVEPFTSNDFLSLKPSHQLFVAKYLETRKHIESYMYAYPHVSRVTAATKGKALLKKPTIALLLKDVLRSGNQIIDDVRRETIKRAADAVLSEVEIDQQLSKIVLGELEVERTIVMEGITVPVKVKPDHSDINRAAELLYKRKGSFSPERHEVKKEGADDPQFSIVLSNGTQIKFG